ncbi:MAG TPA: hypothetical protein EYN67_02850 [Flavobacteriales bacterium]|nr:hypothetical protein [Methylococcaceae bacterium]HHZ94503.1 hypothetical protein [Flavobacteriales bacterium]
MATEKLIVELDAKTAKLDSALSKTDKKLDELDGSVKKTDKSFSNFTKGAAAAAAATLAVAAAVGAAVKEASNFARELEVASNRTGDSVERLQEMAFATNTVGVSLEKLGDIGKDTNEKIGEFLTTGGGGFQDFVDIMKITSQEAEVLAQRFSTMSGTEVLQAMVNQMQAAGVGANQMSFALEGMASDTTDLIPLLLNGGDAMKSLTGEFSDLNTTLSKLDVQKIREVGKEFDKFSGSFAAQSRQLVADYSEEIIKALNVTAFLGEKTIESFNVIAAGWGGLISVAQAALTDFVNGTETFDAALADAAGNSAMRLNELVGEDFYELGVQYGKNIADGMADGMEQNQSKVLEITVRGGKQLTDWEKLDKKQRAGVYKDFITASSKLSETYLEDNKAVRSALVVMDTAAGVQRAFAENNFWVALGQSAVIVASGLTQLNNIKSAGKGGGTISGGGGGVSSQQPPQDDFQPETTGLDLTVADTTGGSSVQQIRFATDSGDELIDTIANMINKGQEEGRF